MEGIKLDLEKLEVIDLGLMEYAEAMSLQNDMVRVRLDGRSGDRLLLVEHPPIITIGRTGNNSDLISPKDVLLEKQIAVFQSDRGGKATFHCPGQLVVYPIIRLKKNDVHWYVRTFLNVVAAVLQEFGLKPALKEGTPGIWVGNRKIASIGISVKKWVAFHGIALNVNNDLTGFDCIIPCGSPGQGITSIKRELGKVVDFVIVKERFVHYFKKSFGFEEPCVKPYPTWPAILTERLNKLHTNKLASIFKRELRLSL